MPSDRPHPSRRAVAIPVAAGELPATVQGPDDRSGVPALVVVPSIYGANADLLDRLAVLGDDALVVVPDPFWRTGEGPVPYHDRDTAIGRLASFDAEACADEMAAAVEWAREHGDGRVVALGICFGGPFVLRLAAAGAVDGIVTWHGSRMERALDDAGAITVPVRHHLGDADPITPPEVITALRDAFADHPDAEVVVHPGATHGFSHDGPAFDEVACRAAVASVVELVTGAG